MRTFIMDTGSNGILISKDLFTPPQGATYLGTGTETLTSSGIIYSGNLYQTDVVINGGASNNTPVATSKVVVLQVTSTSCTADARGCTASQNPTGITYMGVGFNRGVSTVMPTSDNPNQGPLNTNAFINIVSLGSGSTPVTNFQQGYIVTNSGVTLGLNSAATNDFAFVKLTPQSSPSPNTQGGTVWGQAPVTLTVGTRTGPGTILPDTGIDYAFLTPPAFVGISTCPVNPPGGNNCLPSGVPVEVYLPGQTTPQLAMYTLTNSGSMTPAAIVMNVASPDDTFLNTGRNFYTGFDYLYDPTNGFVGYRSQSSSASVTPAVALIGNVSLANGFSISGLPTILFGATTLLETGTGTISSVVSGTGSLTIGSGRMDLTGTNTYSGGTTVTGSATLGISADSGLGNTAGGLALTGGTLLALGNITSARTVTLGTGGGTFNTNGNDITLSTAVSGAGGLTKSGTGILTLSGANSYAGGTVVSAGTLRLATGASLPSTGALTVNGGIIDFNGNNVTVGSLSGLGGTIALGTATLTVAESSNTSLAAVITGTGGLTMAGSGLLNLTGASTYTGPTTVSAGRLAVNGSITSNVTVGSGGNLGGAGTITGGVTNSGTLAPGNSIGTLSVVGSYTQNAGGTYQVESNAAGQADRINVSGAPGTATINGGTVAVLPSTNGPYAMTTTYTILNATGGVSGTFTNATSSLPFLQASLSYDSNNVYLTLKPGGFARGAQTSNQASVGGVLDRSVASATGDFATVIGTLATYSLTQGQAAMTALSGQNYSGFASANLGGGLLFSNMLSQQMSAARGTGVSRESRSALALACDVACDDEPASPWSLWGSAMGGTGSVAGNGNTATVTYNAGGVATGVDYRFDPRFLAGIGVGFSSGSQWASGFSGQGTTNSYQTSLYASFTPGAFYLDALAGYGYNDNQMTRQIIISGLQPRTAQGRTVANQFLGQLEAGYRIGLYAPAAASLTPFARIQGTTVSQAGFSESGAGSLNLNVAAQTTGSARSVLGAELAGAFGAEGRDKLVMQLRLGWAHEYAGTSRPVTANFAGAPGSNFTVFGAAPQRDAATVSLTANTAVAAGTSLFLRYDGEIGNGATSHALNGGLRLTW